MRNNFIAIERGRFCCDPGSSIKILYDPKLNEDETITLAPTGKVDIQEEIDSYAQSVALETLINRFVNGDNDALNRYRAMYLDLTEFPETYAEACQSMVNAERGFDALPTDLKKKYNNNWRDWISQAGSDDWMKDLGLDKKPEPEKEVNENVSE